MNKFQISNEMNKNTDLKDFENADIPLWLVSCELVIDNVNLSNPERRRLQNEKTRIHNDLRTKFQCRQITHSVKRLPGIVSHTSLWSVTSAKAKEEIEKARVYWSKHGKRNGYCSSVQIFPIVTSKEGGEALEWMAEKRERNR